MVPRWYKLAATALAQISLFPLDQTGFHRFFRTAFFTQNVWLHKIPPVFLLYSGIVIMSMKTMQFAAFCDAEFRARFRLVQIATKW
jgi:hypothetical protein